MTMLRYSKPGVLLSKRTLSALALLVAGCGDSGERPTCDAIAEACHPSTTDAGIECHETSEDPATTEDTCSDMEEACLAECQ